MSNLYLINYDLNNAKDYKTLYEELERLGGKRVLASCWAVKSSLSAVSLRDSLKKFIDSDDFLLVAQSRSIAATKVKNLEWFKNLSN